MVLKFKDRSKYQARKKAVRCVLLTALVALTSAVVLEFAEARTPFLESYWLNPTFEPFGVEPMKAPLKK